MGLALLVVDVQRQFLTDKNIFPSAFKVSQEILKTLTFFRDLKHPVIHVHTVIKDDLTDKMLHWSNERALSFTRKCNKDMIPQSLEAREGEAIFLKHHFSAFSEPGVEDLLKKLKIKNVYLVGLYTHACIRSSAIDAMAKGFKVKILENAVASNDPLHAKLSIDYLAHRGVDIQSLEDCISSIRPNAHRTSNDSNPRNLEEPMADSHLMREGKITSQINILGAQLAAWKNLSDKERKKRLQVFYEHFKLLKEEFVMAITQDIAKSERLAEEEYDYALKIAKYILETNAINLDLRLQSSHATEYQHSHGIVAIITAWNNPLAIPLGKILPALLNGNLVAWKPAPQAPKTSSRLTKLFHETLNPNLLAMVTGDAKTGECLCRSPQVSAISFTGSREVGRLIGALAAYDGKPFQGELGGSNSLIVASTNNMQKAALETVLAAFSFSGQKCTAIRRIIILKEHKKAFLDFFLREVKREVALYQDRTHSILSPLISVEQRDYLLSLINESVEDGTQILFGGTPFVGEDKDAWMLPTVLDHVNPQSAINDIELFGPIVIIDEVDSIEEALRVSNQSAFGLVSAIISDKQEELDYFLKESNAGILSMNQCPVVFDPAMPFMGWKDSGRGMPEHGRWDVLFYKKPQAVYKN